MSLKDKKLNNFITISDIMDKEFPALSIESPIGNINSRDNVVVSKLSYSYIVSKEKWIHSKMNIKNIYDEPITKCIYKNISIKIMEDGHPKFEKLKLNIKKECYVWRRF